MGLVYSEGRYFPNCSVRERKALSFIHPSQYHDWIDKTIYTLWKGEGSKYYVKASRITSYPVPWRFVMEVMHDSLIVYDVDMHFTYEEEFHPHDYLPVLFTNKQLARKLAHHLSSDRLDVDAQLRFDRWCRKMLTRMKEY